MPIDLSIITRAAVLIVLVALTGGFAFNALVLRTQSTAALREASLLRRRTWLVLCLAACAAALILDTLALARLEDQPVRLGAAFIARLIIVVALALSLRGTWSESPVAIGLCAALLLTQSMLGHAGREPEWLLPVLADWLHFLFAALWLGGVAYFAVVLVPMVLTQRSLLKPLGEGIARFSPLAILCVLVIGLTGIIQSASFVGSFEALVGTAYGRALMIKLAGFVVLIAFGAFHQAVIGPQLNAWRARAETQETAARRFRVSITIETVVGALTLVAAAAMTVLPLARA